MKSNYCGTTPEMEVFNRSAGTPPSSVLFQDFIL